MADATVLALTGKTLSTEEPKKEKEEFWWMEERPKPEWFVKIKSAEGRVCWFVRFAVTGLRVRRYGPFASKRQCLRFLEDVLKRLMFDGEADLEEAQGKHCMKAQEFGIRQNFYPIAEDMISLHAKTF